MRSLKSDGMEELRSIMLDLANQNLQLCQRLDQQISQTNQQNFILGQRIDMLSMRLDTAIQQSQQQQPEITKLLHEIRERLDKLPGAGKE